MSKKNVVAKLIKGSDNINKMKSEVQRIVGMITSLVDEGSIGDYFLNAPYLDITMKLDSEKVNLCWKVSRLTKDSHFKNILVVRCYSVMSDNNETILYSNEPREMICRTDTIQAVYVTLSSFVECMLKEFPSIKHGMELYLMASKVNI